MDAPKTKSCWVFISPPFALLPILFVAHLFHPIDGLAVERFLDGDMRHRSGRGSAVPVLQSRWKPDHVAGPDLFDRATLALHPSKACGDDQRLAKRVRVPSGPRPRFERDIGAGRAGRLRRLK